MKETIKLLVIEVVSLACIVIFTVTAMGFITQLSQEDEIIKSWVCSEDDAPLDEEIIDEIVEEIMEAEKNLEKDLTSLS